MKKTLALTAMAALFATPIAAQTVESSRSTAGRPPIAGEMRAPAGPMVSGPMGMITPDQFRREALAQDAFQIEASRIAMERSRNPRVLAFAERVQRDHQAMSAALGGGNVVTGMVTGPVGGTLGGAAAGAEAGNRAAGPVGGIVGAGVGAATGAVTGTVGAVADTTASVTGMRRGGAISPQDAATLDQLASASGRGFDRLYARVQVDEARESAALFGTYVQTGTDLSLRSFAQQALPTLEQHELDARRILR